MFTGGFTDRREQREREGEKIEYKPQTDDRLHFWDIKMWVTTYKHKEI